MFEYIKSLGVSAAQNTRNYFTNIGAQLVEQPATHAVNTAAEVAQTHIDSLSDKFVDAVTEKMKNKAKEVIATTSSKITNGLNLVSTDAVLESQNIAKKLSDQAQNSNMARNMSDGVESIARFASDNDAEHSIKVRTSFSDGLGALIGGAFNLFARMISNVLSSIFGFLTNTVNNYAIESRELVNKSFDKQSASPRSNSPVASTSGLSASDLGSLGQDEYKNSMPSNSSLSSLDSQDSLNNENMIHLDNDKKDKPSNRPSI